MRAASSASASGETLGSKTCVRIRSADTATGDSSLTTSWYSSRANVFAICSAARLTASRPLVPKRDAISSKTKLMRSSCCLPNVLEWRVSRLLTAAWCAAWRTRLLSSSASFASTDSNSGWATWAATLATALRTSHFLWAASLGFRVSVGQDADESASPLVCDCSSSQRVMSKLRCESPISDWEQRGEKYLSSA